MLEAPEDLVASALQAIALNVRRSNARYFAWLVGIEDAGKRADTMARLQSSLVALRRGGWQE